MKSIRDRVLAITNALQAELQDLGVMSLELFGSVARDEARPDSDVDFFSGIRDRVAPRFVRSRYTLKISLIGDRTSSNSEYETRS